MVSVSQAEGRRERREKRKWCQIWTQMNTDFKDFKYINLTERIIILAPNQKLNARHSITRENSLLRASAKISVPM